MSKEMNKLIADFAQCPYEDNHTSPLRNNYMFDKKITDNSTTCCQ